MILNDVWFNNRYRYSDYSTTRSAGSSIYTETKREKQKRETNRHILCLQTDSFVQTTVQKTHTLHSLSYMTEKSCRTSDPRGCNRQTLQWLVFKYQSTDQLIELWWILGIWNCSLPVSPTQVSDTVQLHAASARLQANKTKAAFQRCFLVWKRASGGLFPDVCRDSYLHIKLRSLGLADKSYSLSSSLLNHTADLKIVSVI